MEPQFSFDLHQAMIQWRNTLSTQPGITAEQLHEIEGHLLESAAELKTRGLSEEESFWIAAKRLGPTSRIAEEFAKAEPADVWSGRVFWMAAGMLFSYFSFSLYGTVAHFFSGILARNGITFLWFYAIGYTAVSVLLAWFALSMAKGREPKFIHRLVDRVGSPRKFTWIFGSLVLFRVIWQLIQGGDFWTLLSNGGISDRLDVLGSIILMCLWPLPVAALLIYLTPKSVPGKASRAQSNRMVVSTVPPQTHSQQRAETRSRRNMEHQSSFDLSKAINEWRFTMSSEPGITAEQSRELEVHLADSVGALKSQGLDDEEAFWIASRRLGSASRIAREFAKADPVKLWRERTFWITAGMLITYYYSSLYYDTAAVLSIKLHHIWEIPFFWINPIGCAVIGSFLFWFALSTAKGRPPTLVRRFINLPAFPRNLSWIFVAMVAIGIIIKLMVMRQLWSLNRGSGFSGRASGTMEMMFASLLWPLLLAALLIYLTPKSAPSKTSKA